MNVERHLLLGNLLRIPATSSLRVAVEKRTNMHFSKQQEIVTEAFALFESARVHTG